MTGDLNLASDGRVKLEGGNLTITSLRKEDHGRYECQAENEVKTIVVGTDLIIQSNIPLDLFLCYKPFWKINFKSIFLSTFLKQFFNVI